MDLPRGTDLALGAFGRAAARAAGLVGLFGVDFVYAAGVAVPVEINPRYPASAEVIEFATGWAVLADHRRGCHGPVAGVTRPAAHRVVGKAVYFAPRTIRFPAAGPWDDDGRPFDPWRLPDYADIPDPGATIEPGWPVLTLFAAGSTAAEVRGRLQSRAAVLDRRFAEGASP